MTDILHLVRDPRDARAFETVLAHAREGLDRVRLVLLHDAVIPGPHRVPGVETLVVADDCRARGLEPPPDALSYSALHELLFACDKAILW